MIKAEILTQFSEVATTPYEWLKDYLQYTDQKAIGYFCSYFPEELIHAAGFLPVRIWGSTDFPSAVNAHLQSYCCYTIKSALGLLFDRKLDCLYGVIFSHTCDAMQSLTDIWKIHAADRFHDTFNMPTCLDGGVALDYTTEEVRRLKHNLEIFIEKPISLVQINSSIHLFNESRGLIRELYQRRSKSPAVLSALELHHLITASTIMPREEHIKLVKSLLSHLTVEEQDQTAVSKIVFVGAVINDPAIYAILEELNAVVIDDDTCSGSRAIARTIPFDDDHLRAIAHSLLDRSPCPCKYKQNFNPGTELIKRVLDCNADGVIFYLQKFCDPHFIDYPYLRSKLSAANIPSLLIEAEKPGSNLSQVRNRIQAFVEMIRNE